MKNIDGLKQANQEISQLTKESIIQATIILSEEKNFEKLSISEIVEKAGVSRSAYYRHFDSKEAILESAIESTLLEAILLIQPDTNFFL